MLGDLNTILDGLTELEDKGIETIDCRRAQFSAQEPIIRLRMICQSWKVMFQAEYSSGQPLRMLVDLRASVEYALGRGKAPEAEVKAKAEVKEKPAPGCKRRRDSQACAGDKARVDTDARRETGGAGEARTSCGKSSCCGCICGCIEGRDEGCRTGRCCCSKPKARPGAPKAEAPEFEVSGTPGWDSDSTPEPGTKK